MESEPIANLESQVEAKRIAALLNRSKKELGNFDLVLVGKAGYILQSEREKPTTGGDWVFFDYDDTLVASTEVMERRLELYRTYLEGLGIQATGEQSEKIMEMTDKFSIWEESEREGEGELYHANTHMAALQWATNILRESQNGVDESITDLQERLGRIETQLTQEQQPQENDPFYFRSEDKKFILRGIGKMWSKDMKDIFAKSVINPPQYEETIGAAKKAGRPSTSIHRINLGVFTYGDPYYQLLKVFGLMKQHPGFPISQIWLTRRPKGDFISEAVKTKPGYVLGQTGHVIVMVDDNPEQLSSILSARDSLEGNIGFSLVAVRSKRAGTKNQNKEWQVNVPNGELDFTSRSFLPRHILNILELIIITKRFS